MGRKTRPKQNGNDVLVNFRQGGPLDGDQRVYPRARVRLDQTLVLPFGASNGLEHVYESLGAIEDENVKEVDVFYRGVCETC